MSDEAPTPPSPMSHAEQRARFSFLDALEAHAATFREEYEALPDTAFAPMPNAGGYAAHWEACPLFLGQWEQDFPGVDLAANRVLAPRTAAVLDGIDGLIIGGFLRLAPGMEIHLHEDFRDDDVIRAHLGLTLPPHERAYWDEGTARLMDIRAPHQAHNLDGEAWRVTMMVDVRMPFPVPLGAVPPWGPPEPAT